MPTGSSIRAKIARTLEKLNATGRPVYWRVVTTTGGNPILGIHGTTTTVDTLISPQPAVDKVPTEQVVSSGGRLQIGDYRLTFDGTVSETYFATRLLVYGSSVLKIVSVDPFAIYGTIVAYEVIAREVV
jgi:hypothetical protein